ncbi:50S ribosomal protein L11 [archaeon]|nr:50S ribosomal protein L11 [archaeon]
MNVKLMVDGGAMKPGPAVSQKLGPAGVNINEVIAKVNEATKNFKGMQVPVEITVDSKAKTFEVEVFSPPISGLIKKEAGIQTGSGNQGKIKVANMSIEQIINVAQTKMPNLLCKDLKAAVKITVGSCASLGILVESKSAPEVETDIDSGMYDEQIKNCVTETPEEKRKELDQYFAGIKAKQDLILKQTAEAEESAKKKK